MPEIKMGTLLKCEDENIVLRFIQTHPDVTIAIDYDNISDAFVIGMHTTSGGQFKKSKFIVSAKANRRAVDIDRDLYEALYRAYNEVAIRTSGSARVI